MGLKFCSSHTVDELLDILKLQKENLPAAISEREKAKEGFVTVSHNLEILSAMNAIFPHTIAKDGDKLIGYALSMHPKFGGEIEVLKPMFDEIEKFFQKDKSFIVMGQICIAKDYRGKGIFRKLYASMQNAVKNHFDCIITEVDATNTRSLNAHYAIGFKDLKVYKSGGREWHIVVL